MRRIGLAVALALRLILAPLAAAGAENIPKVALLFTGTPEAEISGPNPTSPSARGFLEGMRELGWAAGQNIVIERRSAKGDPNRYLPLIHEMMSLKVDVIVISVAPPFVIAAQQATRTIPIVMAELGDDPVRLGLANSYATPGGNVTGSTFTAGPGIGGKRLELLKEVAPATARAAFIAVPADAPTESAARALGVTIVPVPFNVQKGMADVLSVVVQKKANALVVGGNIAWAHRRAVIDLAAKAAASRDVPIE